MTDQSALHGDPALSKILVRHDEISGRVQELGQEIANDYAGRAPLLSLIHI